MKPPFDIVILGLSVTSSWGNGHATTYRSLIRGLAARGHRVLFLERDQPWYAGNRDEPHPAGAHTELYNSFDELIARFERAVREAGLVIVGSFVPDGVARGRMGHVGRARASPPSTTSTRRSRWRKLAAGEREYITPELIRALSICIFPSPAAHAALHREPLRLAHGARALLLGGSGAVPARRGRAAGTRLSRHLQRRPAAGARSLHAGAGAAVARGTLRGGRPDVSGDIQWPANVDREIHLSPREHPAFYGAQRFTLNVTRAAMKQAGYSPSVRLFEAGACGVPIISDWWEGSTRLFGRHARC